MSLCLRSSESARENRLGGGLGRGGASSSCLDWAGINRAVAIDDSKFLPALFQAEGNKNLVAGLSSSQNILCGCKVPILERICAAHAARRCNYCANRLRPTGRDT